MADARRPDRSLAQLVIGLAFGLLVGFGIYRATAERLPPAPAASPQGSAFQTLMQELEPLRERLERDPNDAEARIRIGDRLFQAGLWSQALEFYEQARRSRPADPDLLTVIGLCQRELGLLEAARESFSRALELAPDHWAARYNTAVVHLDRGELEQAEALVQALESASPGDARLEPLRRALAQARAQRP